MNLILLTSKGNLGSNKTQNKREKSLIDYNKQSLSMLNLYKYDF